MRRMSRKLESGQCLGEKVGVNNDRGFGTFRCQHLTAHLFFGGLVERSSSDFGLTAGPV